MVDLSVFVLQGSLVVGVTITDGSKKQMFNSALKFRELVCYSVKGAIRWNRPQQCYRILVK